MVLPVKDSFADLERHRLRLEGNVSKLQKALKHWQMWEAEYEGLKEEILAFHGDPQPEDLIAIGKDFGGTIVTEKEISELLGDGQNVRRNAAQVINVLSRRIEYVQKNAKTVEKQLLLSEDKLNSIVVISKPDIRNEEGLPIMEIREELDENDNVISSSATAPSDSTPQMIEALRKAGVTDFGAIGHTETAKQTQIENATSKPLKLSGQMKQFQANENVKPEPNNSQPPQPKSMGTISQDLKPSPRKKTVTFVEDKKEERQQRLPDYKGPNNTPKRPVAQNYGADSGRITKVMEEEEGSSPVVPIDEPPEDAALRKEMLKYTFSEVGAVVAELDLEEDENQDSYSDDCDEGSDEEDQEPSSAEEEEDKFGRSTRRIVDDKYRKEMEALERKLNSRMMENVGPRPSISDVTEDLKQPSVTHNLSAKTATHELKKPGKKGVRFAEELDISPTPQNATVAAVPENGNQQPTLEDSIFERGSMTGGPPKPEPPKPRKVSRFKSLHAPGSLTTKQLSNSSTLQSVNDGGSLANGPLSNGIIERRVPGTDPSLSLIPATAKSVHQFSHPIVLREVPRVAPEDPPGKALSGGVVERFTADRSAEPSGPDDLDAALLRQEATMKYHRMRNRMIQREGGFMPREEELERVPLTKEEGGSGKKVSRFKAARLGC